MHEIARRAREHAVRLERAFARPQEPLDPLAAYPIVVEMAQEADSIERAEDVSLLARRALAMTPEQLLDLVTGENVAGDAPEEALQILRTERSR